MSDKPVSNEDRKLMSFREAEGTASPPAALQWGEIDDELRLEIWDVWYELLQANLHDDWFTEPFWSTLARIFRVHTKIPIDDARSLAEFNSSASKHLKSIIFGEPYQELLNLLQCSLRVIGSDTIFYSRLGGVLESPRSPYLLIHDPPTIVPKGSPEEGETVAKDLQAISVSGLSGAREHLISAAEALNKGDNRGAIREAIHAVESASKIVSGKPHATLPDCLKVLEKERGLHPALKKAFDNLYGYTSDEKGIRHALLDGDNEKVGVDEALFMFSACTAFISYLARKFPKQS